MSLLKLSKIGDVSYSTLRATEKRNGQLSVDTIYTILVNGQETYLFFERSANLTGRVIGTWYVERQSA